MSEPPPEVRLFQIGDDDIHGLASHELEAFGLATRNASIPFATSSLPVNREANVAVGRRKLLRFHCITAMPSRMLRPSKVMLTQRLYDVEGCIELAGLCLGGKEQRRRNQSQQTARTDERHTLELGAYLPLPLSLRQEEAGAAHGGQSRHQQDEAPGDGRLDRDHRDLGRKQFGNGGREPERRYRENGDQASKRMDDP